MNIRAAASPKIRPDARIVPVIKLGNATGSRIEVIIFHLDSPSARPASFCSFGTARKACSVVRTISGKLKIARAKAPEIREKPRPN
ncbi:hypothetical protein D3C74_392760 [compost metagenome]